MTNKSRIKKTLGRKFSDLDDHLYFLKDSLAKLIGGDPSYIKQVAAELRVLICKAGVEGLMWRVNEEIEASDIVSVHLPGDVNLEHPLAKDLKFFFVPLMRTGLGDPRLIPGEYSLKGIIKNSEAIMVSGDTYTHENLIRAISEQMGSAHEDEGVTPFLVELSNTIVSDQAALSATLISVADLVIEVGEGILSKATNDNGFLRKNRPEISIGTDPVKAYFESHSDFENISEPLPEEGTVMFLVDHPHGDWRTNNHEYNFGLFRQGQLEVQARKNKDKNMEIHVKGFGQAILSIENPIPNFEQPGVMIGLTWNSSQLNFYLNGVRIETMAIESER
ncbi:MAG: hypothetical protein FHK82_18210 [Sedimenticola thiotaurini]|uniref:Uncharacterized protein n=1 Tax=Sedimenticola thiotaurini TaxID=1543721 RepID=A0A558CE98_9GAMM|nr:MAG: hypothetical protein FHK82_18210 [Sedimenticola thiotaurini]